MNITMNPDAEQKQLPSLVWDVNTALATLIFGALIMLLLIRAGFRGFNVPGLAS